MREGLFAQMVSWVSPHTMQSGLRWRLFWAQASVCKQTGGCGQDNIHGQLVGLAVSPNHILCSRERGLHSPWLWMSGQAWSLFTASAGCEITPEWYSCEITFHSGCETGLCESPALKLRAHRGAGMLSEIYCPSLEGGEDRKSKKSILERIFVF